MCKSNTERMIQSINLFCIERLNGMFAIAILDREDDSLYLVRDRIGKKPLYYYVKEENLYFASELKPIMKVEGFVKEIETEIIGNYLHHMCPIILLLIPENYKSRH